MTMSLEGFVSERHLSALYPDLDALRKTEMLRESIKATGAVVMCRRAYDIAGRSYTLFDNPGRTELKIIWVLESPGRIGIRHVKS